MAMLVGSRYARREREQRKDGPRKYGKADPKNEAKRVNDAQN